MRNETGLVVTKISEVPNGKFMVRLIELGVLDVKKLSKISIEEEIENEDGVFFSLEAEQKNILKQAINTAKTAFDEVSKATKKKALVQKPKTDFDKGKGNAYAVDPCYMNAYCNFMRTKTALTEAKFAPDLFPLEQTMDVSSLGCILEQMHRLFEGELTEERQQSITGFVENYKQKNETLNVGTALKEYESHSEAFKITVHNHLDVKAAGNFDPELEGKKYALVLAMEFIGKACGKPPYRETNNRNYAVLMHPPSRCLLPCYLGLPYILSDRYSEACKDHSTMGTAESWTKLKNILSGAVYKNEKTHGGYASGARTVHQIYSCLIEPPDSVSGDLESSSSTSDDHTDESEASRKKKRKSIEGADSV